MIKTIVSAGLPVDESLIIQKNIIRGKSGVKRICIVTGTHGDELEGQYVCYELIRRLNEKPEHLNGQVEVYPALNPLGIDSVKRGFPTFDIDMNRIFPGATDGHLIENIVHQITQDLKGADMVIDIHASNIFLEEMPQARINIATARKLVPYAEMLNIDFIWVHDAATVLESTLSHTLNSMNTPTIVVEMGIGMRINREYGDMLIEGILNMMKQMGMWTGPVKHNTTTPFISTKGEVHFINADASGIILPRVKHSSNICKGDLICQIVNPLTGEILQNIKSPIHGTLFTLRTYPVVYEGSLIARIFAHKTKNA